MAEACPLGQLLTESRDDGIAHRLKADIARAAGWLRQQPAAPVALFLLDPVLFAIWLLAIWQAGRCAILPGDATPATAQRLQARGALLIGDLPGADQSGPVPEHAAIPLRTIAETEAVVEVFTSGSTGEPVSLVKSLRQLDAEVKVLEQVFGTGLRQDWKFHTTVSHQHLYGLLFCILWPLARGQAALASTIAYPEALLSAGDDYVLVSSPAFLKRLPTELAWPGPSHCQQVFSSGGPLPAQAAIDARNCLDAPVTEIYGSSETGGIARRSDPAAAWTVQPGVAIRLEDTGHLAVRSAFLPDAGWFVTADLARLSADGFVLQGRSDRIVKIEEKRISLTALQCHLEQHAAISEARIVPLDGVRTQLAAVVVLSESGENELARHGKFALGQALRAHLASAFERVALPRRWRFVEQLPVNHMGKTTDAALADLFIEKPRLPRVLQQENIGAGLKLQLELTPDLACFDGHFPTLPILPGVAQLDWAVHFATTLLGTPGEFRGMDAIKFQKIMQPGLVVDLQLDYLPEKQQVQFRYQSAAGVHASGRIRLGEKTA